MAKPCEVLDSRPAWGSPTDSVEAWAAAYVASGTPEQKLAPPPVPTLWAGNGAECAVPGAPGRNTGYEVVSRASKFPRMGSLREAAARAKVLHTFLHHEVQAAELYCRAILLFSGAPRPFREGLLRVAQDEIRHAQLYQGLLKADGSSYGALPVRDWFWQRGLECADPISFVAFVGMGLEGANLDHADRFEIGFREAGSEACARVQAQVGREEEAHVRFALHWFGEWTDGSFESWCQHLPKPLSPLIFRSAQLNRSSRLRAGLSSEFLEQLEAWRPSGS